MGFPTRINMEQCLKLIVWASLLSIAFKNHHLLIVFFRKCSFFAWHIFLQKKKIYIKNLHSKCCKHKSMANAKCKVFYTAQ